MTRFLELDATRGIAILCMVIYHAVFDYTFFIQKILDVNSGIVLVIGRTAAVLFLLLVGISLTIQYYKLLHNQNSNHSSIFMKRGLFIFGIGLGITLITGILFPQYIIWFGILHLIGASIILSIPLVKHKNISGILGGIILLTGAYFYITLSSGNAFITKLIPILPAQIQTFDYFPLFPWIGIVWIGIFLGHYLYPNGKQLLQIKKENPVLNFFGFLGKYSLAIYLIHQPILVGIVLAGKMLF